ncbi:MAG: hypothetical protein ACR2JQ_11250 [Mycobacteriales bacterium]
MRRFIRSYGANPLHLLALLASFALAGYAAVQLVPSKPIGVIVWFVGAAVGHDLLLVPLYGIVDRSLIRLGRHRGDADRDDGLPAAPWLNYLRVPLVLSGFVLVVYFPGIFRLSGVLPKTSDLSSAPYLRNWLAVTGVLFLVSAITYAVRLRRERRRSLADQPE